MIVYLDESGFAHDMPRTHGYSDKGERGYGPHDWHSKGRVKAIGAIAGNRLLSICLFDGNIDSDVFYSGLTEDRIPKLPAGSVVVLDHAAFHKRADMQTAVRQAKPTLLYLPPYSPDLNPIEKQWAQAKAIRRQRRCSAVELFSAALK